MEVRTTQPTARPVTTPDCKEHMRITHTLDDDYIDRLITAATEFGEKYTGRPFYTQTWTKYLAAWPVDYIRIEHPPLQSVVEIRYLDENGAQQTLASSEYRVSTVRGEIHPAWNVQWPVVRNIVDAIEIEFVAGYGEEAEIPEDIRHALKICVEHLYEERNPVVMGLSVNEVPFNMRALLDQYRVYQV